MYFGSNSIMVQSYRDGELAVGAHWRKQAKGHSCKRFNQRKNIDVPD
jgi:hypothetical protein